MRKKDVVLMATVTSFESLQFPTKSELRQFAELFAPLFKASTDEAKRQAVAALSQGLQVPPAVALFIGSQPIGISAIFLTCSQAIDDNTLITIARTQGTAHARAIARRENLSPTVIDALVDLHQASPERGIAEMPPPAAAEPAESPAAIAVGPAHAALPAAPETPRAAVIAAPELSREDAVREELRRLAKHFFPAANDRLGLRSLSEMQRALLVRFARSREAEHFATTLADTLSSSRWLAERIMLDVSGQQLATTLVSLGAEDGDAIFMLTRLYPHLAEPAGTGTRAARLLATLNADECHARVESWRRADSYTFLPEQAEEPPRIEPDAGQRPRHVQQLRPVRELRSIGRR